jgi:D-amino-acid dehydrogenase
VSKRVIIVGGGIVGLCSALYAARRGHDVVLLDRRPEEYLGSSFGNAGLVSPSHFIPLAAPGTLKLAIKWMMNPESPFYLKPRLDADLISWGIKFMRAATAEHVAASAPVLARLLLESQRGFEELAAEWGNEFQLVRRGILNVCKTAAHLEHEIALGERGRALGIPTEVFDAKTLAQLEPDIRIDAAGAVLYPDDAHVSPNLFMKSIRKRLESMIEFRWGTEVKSWSASNGRVASIATNQGEIKGDEYVVCGGAWSSTVVKSLGLRLPLQAGKGYSLTLPRAKQMPTRPMILMEGRVAVTPMGDSLRFGGTMEIAGYDESINPARVRGIMKTIPQYLPDYGPHDFEGIEPWCGMRPCSPDGLPYIGRFRKYSNLIAATGHAMIGVSLGPGTGKLVASLLSGEPPGIDLVPVSPDRYA